MSRWRELNPWPLPYQGSALPLSYNGWFKFSTPKLAWAERETRLEPATYSLEGCRSTNWATPAIQTQSLKCCVNCRGGKWWIRTTEAEATDLQSVPFSHSGNFPFTIWSHLSGSNQRPTDYKSVALPAELKWRVKELNFYIWPNRFSAKRTAKKDKKIDISKRLHKKYS